jgi:hypothetical protein
VVKGGQESNLRRADHARRAVGSLPRLGVVDARTRAGGAGAGRTPTRSPQRRPRSRPLGLRKGLRRRDVEPGPPLRRAEALGRRLLRRPWVSPFTVGRSPSARCKTAGS